jgi:hypothetical protein
MEKEILERLIINCDREKKFLVRDELLDVYVRLWPQDYDECSLFELLEKEPLHH